MAQEQFEVIIMGTGPAGLQAAIHAARSRVSVLVTGRVDRSSLYRAHVENYYALGKTDGETLLKEGLLQAENAGAQFLGEDVIRTAMEDDWFIVRTESGKSLKARSLVLALGVHRNRLNVPGEKDFLGKGVSYCVDCDAGFFKGADVAVAGGASAAVSGALTMLFYARSVHLIAEKLEVSERLAHQATESGVILHLDRKIRELIGPDALSAIILDDGSRIDASGLFIETGAKGAVELVVPLGVALDDEKAKYVKADKDQQTSVPGIFAAGDICGPPWQVAKAVGEGCVAGLSAARHAKTFR